MLDTKVKPLLDWIDLSFGGGVVVRMHEGGGRFDGGKSDMRQ